MKARILLVIVGSIVISCSNRTQNKQTNTTDKKDTAIIQKTETSVDIATEKYRALEKKANWFKHGLKKQNDLTDLPETFVTFYTKFISDSVYQKENVNFERLIGENVDCEETTFLNEKNWGFIEWDFIKFFKEGSETEPIEKWSNSVYIGENKIFFEFELMEIGVLYQLGFEKINNRWNLTLFYTNAC